MDQSYGLHGLIRMPLVSAIILGPMAKSSETSGRPALTMGELPGSRRQSFVDCTMIKHKFSFAVITILGSIMAFRANSVTLIFNGKWLR